MSKSDDIKKEKLSQSGLIMEYFEGHPKRDISHPEIVDWATGEWLERTGEIFRDPDRAIRKLHQNGYLIKVNKGIYRYDPSMIQIRELEDFTPALRKQIFERDDYKCVICGRGRNEGVEIHADHIKPKDLGGGATLQNGQTLCSQHNFLKKNFKQTETGKKMYIRLYEIAKQSGDENLLRFCTEILEVYEKNDMNGHIVWEK
ncbi:MAG: HNH endonuclease signature motif containing protein [Patescibacteria group bacterium]